MLAALTWQHSTRPKKTKSNLCPPEAQKPNTDQGTQTGVRNYLEREPPLPPLRPRRVALRETAARAPPCAFVTPLRVSISLPRSCVCSREFCWNPASLLNAISPNPHETPPRPPFLGCDDHVQERTEQLRGSVRAATRCVSEFLNRTSNPTALVASHHKSCPPARGSAKRNPQKNQKISKKQTRRNTPEALQWFFSGARRKQLGNLVHSDVPPNV